MDFLLLPSSGWVVRRISFDYNKKQMLINGKGLNMENQRYAELDIAKGIGILLVLTGHIQYISIGLREFIVAFHIPLFFIITGMLICVKRENEKRLWQTVKKKSRSILQPYLIFSVLFLIIQFVLYKTGYAITIDMIKQNIYLTVILYGMSVLWFLAALFLGEVAFLGIIKSCKEKWTPLILIIWLILSCAANRQLQYYCALYSNRSVTVYLMYLGQAVLRIGIVTFLIGVGFYLWKLKERVKMTVWGTGLTGIICLGSTIVISHINGGTDLHYLVFNKEYLYFPGAILGSMGILGISYCLNKFDKFPLLKVLKFYGKNSLIVMVTHVDTYLMYFSTIVVMHFNKDILDYNGNVRFCVELFLLVTVAEGVIVLIINRYFPWIIGKRRKGE